MFAKRKRYKDYLRLYHILNGSYTLSQAKVKSVRRPFRCLPLKFSFLAVRFVVFGGFRAEANLPAATIIVALVSLIQWLVGAYWNTMGNIFLNMTVGKEPLGSLTDNCFPIQIRSQICR